MHIPSYSVMREYMLAVTNRECMSSETIGVTFRRSVAHFWRNGKGNLLDKRRTNRRCYENTSTLPHDFKLLQQTLHNMLVFLAKLMDKKKALSGQKKENLAKTFLVVYSLNIVTALYLLKS